MSLAFTKATSATRRAKVLLIGEAGTGKTHAALTFPKPAVIDAEGSSDWFADRFEFSAVNTKSYADARELVTQVRNGRVPCETLVIDSLTSIYNGLLMAASATREDLRPIDWGRIKRKFSSLLDELYHKTDKHVVCIGWIKPEYAKPGDVVNGKSVSANDLVKVGEAFDGDKKTMYAFDFVFKIEGNDGKKTRATVIKSRSGALVAGQKIDDFSFATIAKLLPTGARAASGMSDEEQIARDRDLELAIVPDAREQTPTEKLVARAEACGVIASGGGLDALRMYATGKGVALAVGAMNAHLDAVEAERATSAQKPANAPETASWQPSDKARKAMFALHGELGHKDADRYAFYSQVCGRPITSASQLGKLDFEVTLKALGMALDAQNAAAV